MAELVVRVQWDGNYTEVSDGGSGRRRTIAYNAGQDVHSSAAAAALGQAVLRTLGPQTSVQATIGDSDFWPEIGDAIDVQGFAGVETQRLVGRQVRPDRNGFATLHPTLGSPTKILTERLAQAIRNQSAGSTTGRSAGVSPSSSMRRGVPSGVIRAVRIPEWSLSGLRVWDGPLWPAEEAVVATKAHLVMTAPAPADDISVFLNVGGAFAHAITLPQGDTEISVLGALLIRPKQNLQVSIDSIGANTEAQLEDHKLTVKFTAAPAQLRVEQSA